MKRVLEIAAGIIGAVLLIGGFALYGLCLKGVLTMQIHEGEVAVTTVVGTLLLVFGVFHGSRR